MKSEAEPPFAAARQNLIDACSEMERRLNGLGGSDERLSHEVHELRKLGKRLRGGLVIAREAKPCVRWISVIGKLLGGTRDAVVRVETWKRLGLDDTEKGSIERVIGAMIGQVAERAAGEPPREAVEWSLVALGQVRSRLESMSDAEVAERCRKGGTQMLRRLRGRLKRVVEEVEDEDFHEARKAVQAWLGGMRMVAPGQVLPGAKLLEELGDVLGKEHDFEVLGEWLAEHGFSSATAPRVWKRLPKLQSKARRRSLGLIRKEALPVLKRLPVRSGRGKGGEISGAR